MSRVRDEYSIKECFNELTSINLFLKNKLNYGPALNIAILIFDKNREAINLFFLSNQKKKEAIYK